MPDDRIIFAFQKLILQEMPKYCGRFLHNRFVQKVAKDVDREGPSDGALVPEDDLLEDESDVTISEKRNCIPMSFRCQRRQDSLQLKNE